MHAIEPAPDRLAITALPAAPNEYSTDLVPTRDVRAAYNQVPHVITHGEQTFVYRTNLEHHDDALTADQAERINQHFDVEIALGTHGIVENDPKSRFDPYHRFSRPTQREYVAAKRVVEGLQPGDTLFVEGYGFSEQAPRPFPIIDTAELRARANQRTDLMGRLAMQLYSETLLQQYEQARADGYARVERGRQTYSSSAWDYATGLALVKGIEVVYADGDSFDAESMRGISGDKGQLDMLRSEDANEKALADRVQTLRERLSRNVLKDWALAHLPPEGTPPPTGRKPKLVLLFGAAHEEGLKEAFEALKINVSTTNLDSSSTQERLAEQTAVLLGEIAQSMVGSMGVMDSAMPGPLERPVERDRERGPIVQPYAPPVGESRDVQYKSRRGFGSQNLGRVSRSGAFRRSENNPNDPNE